MIGTFTDVKFPREANKGMTTSLSARLEEHVSSNTGIPSKFDMDLMMSSDLVKTQSLILLKRM